MVVSYWLAGSPTHTQSGVSFVYAAAGSMLLGLLIKASKYGIVRFGLRSMTAARYSVTGGRCFHCLRGPIAYDGVLLSRLVLAKSSHQGG